MATLAANRAIAGLSATFPGIKFGVTNCRKIAGSESWSQHSWSNALDLYFTQCSGDQSPEHQAKLDKVYTWLVVHGEELDIKYRCWRRPNHYDHIHVDFWPTGHLVPSCAGPGKDLWRYSSGLITGIYKLETEDEMPQFTEEEAWDLKTFLAILYESESSVYFANPAVELIREERKIPLHSHTGEVLIDAVARDRIADLLEKLRAV